MASNQQDAEQVELDTYISVLDRDQLEQLLVRMIVKDPDNFDHLEDATTYLSESTLMQTLEPCLEMSSASELSDAINPIMERYVGYTKLKRSVNAMIVLYAITTTVLTQLIESGLDKDDNDQKVLIQRLETAWKEICDIYIPPTQDEIAKKRELANNTGTDPDLISPPHTLVQIFEKLAQWRLEMEKELGPVFSDALRVLKLRIQKEVPVDEQPGGKNTITMSTTTSSKKGDDEDTPPPKRLRKTLVGGPKK